MSGVFGVIELLLYKDELFKIQTVTKDIKKVI